jgi:hypothetical protein
MVPLFLLLNLIGNSIEPAHGVLNEVESEKYKLILSLVPLFVISHVKVRIGPISVPLSSPQSNEKKGEFEVAPLPSSFKVNVPPSEVFQIPGAVSKASFLQEEKVIANKSANVEIVNSFIFV